MSNQPFFPGGGIDLSALAAQREAAERAAASRESAPAGVIVEVTEENFQAEVIERSMTVPVVIDFWAEWCEPCKQLSPVIEKLINEAGGRLVLATIDADSQERLAAAFKVQSIPSVFAVVGGQPLPLFQGALPEAQVKAVLAELLKAAEESGVTGQVGAPDAVEDVAAEIEEVVDTRFDDAADAIDSGEWDVAIGIYESILSQSPGDEWAKAALVQVQLMKRTDGIDGADAIARAEANPADVEAVSVAADALVVSGDVEGAFALLINCVRETSGAERNTARERLVALFDVVGPEHPALAPARVALANALF